MADVQGMKMIVCTLIVCATVLMFGKFIWPAPPSADERFGALNARIVQLQIELANARVKEMDDVFAEGQKRLKGEGALFDIITSRNATAQAQQ